MPNFLKFMTIKIHILYTSCMCQMLNELWSIWTYFLYVRALVGEEFSGFFFKRRAENVAIINVLFTKLFRVVADAYCSNIFNYLLNVLRSFIFFA